MAGYAGILDWTGLSTGVPSSTPSCGYDGILDWTGIPCGVPVTTPSCGYDGILDWTGIPCGVPVTVQCGYDGIIDWTGIPCGVPETPEEPSGGGDWFVHPVPKVPHKPKVPRKPEEKLHFLEEIPFVEVTVQGYAPDCITALHISPREARHTFRLQEPVALSSHAIALETREVVLTSQAPQSSVYHNPPTLNLSLTGALPSFQSVIFPDVAKLPVCANDVSTAILNTIEGSELQIMGSISTSHFAYETPGTEFHLHGHEVQINSFVLVETLDIPLSHQAKREDSILHKNLFLGS